MEAAAPHVPVVTGCRRAARANGRAGAKRRPANSEGTSSGPPRPGLAARGGRRPARLAVARAKGRGVGQYGGRWRPGVVGERPRGRGGVLTVPRGSGPPGETGVSPRPPERLVSRCGSSGAGTGCASHRAPSYGTWGRVLPRPAVPRLRAAGVRRRDWGDAEGMAAGLPLLSGERRGARFSSSVSLTELGGRPWGK